MVNTFIDFIKSIFGSHKFEFMIIHTLSPCAGHHEIFRAGKPYLHSATNSVHGLNFFSLRVPLPSLSSSSSLPLFPSSSSSSLSSPSLSSSPSLFFGFGALLVLLPHSTENTSISLAVKLYAPVNVLHPLPIGSINIYSLKVVWLVQFWFALSATWISCP